MRHDDAPVGRLLSRRQVVTLLGSTGAAWIAAGLVAPRAGAAVPAQACVVRPEQTEGPYFVDERLNRSDIRSDPTGGVKAGTPLALTMLVSRFEAGSCRPLAGAIVDIWHCDARGIYSDVEDSSFNTTGQKFLRGYQVTGAGGEAQFLTIYPGCYPGRAVHIHFKIRAESAARRSFEFTSQLYFDDAMTDRVHAAAAYAESRAQITRNREDRIFRRGGDQLTLAPTAAAAAGYAASFAVALDLS